MREAVLAYLGGDVLDVDGTDVEVEASFCGKDEVLELEVDGAVFVVIDYDVSILRLAAVGAFFCGDGDDERLGVGLAFALRLVKVVRAELDVDDLLECLHVDVDGGKELVVVHLAAEDNGYSDGIALFVHTEHGTVPHVNAFEVALLDEDVAAVAEVREAVLAFFGGNVLDVDGADVDVIIL